MRKRILDVAIDYARDHKYDSTLAACVCAVIFSGGRVISVGYNAKGRDSALQRRYRVNPHCCSIHAEVAAVLNVRRKIDLTGAKIVVVRRFRDDSPGKPRLGMARPCPMCQAVLYSYGIKRAVYTISNDEHGVMNLTDPRRDDNGNPSFDKDLSDDVLSTYERDN
jgi:tRNA(Arg) A34 adenosine deaminase TadA